MMLYEDDNRAIRTRRGLKRSISPTESNLQNLKTKNASQMNKNGSNKENLIKRCQSEMIMKKQAPTVCSNKTNEKRSSWYSGHRLWENLISRTMDSQYQCKENILDAHPTVTNKMRSVLYDWLIEVCDVYHLHRETYHLSIAYIDQYLSRTSQFGKQKFQLLGITSLFVASKIEEIYPPRLCDFTYVTDNACSEQEILEMELDLMNILEWHLDPVTSISWLLVYLQVQFEFEQISKKKNPLKKEFFSELNLRQELISSKSSINQILDSSLLSQVHRSRQFLDIFSEAARLLDICSLDLDYIRFPKNILAATAILCCRPTWPLQQLTGLKENDVKHCRDWMKDFQQVLSQRKFTIKSRPTSSIPFDEIYSIQSHQISVDLLESVHEIRLKNPAKMRNRPFQDLFNQISWLPSLSENNKCDEESHSSKADRLVLV